MRTVAAIFLMTAVWYLNEQTKDRIHEGDDGWGFFMGLSAIGVMLCVAQDIKQLLF